MVKWCVMGLGWGGVGGDILLNLGVGVFLTLESSEREENKDLVLRNFEQ